jgi:tetratricopeptide (TPR) repeat protein
MSYSGLRNYEQAIADYTKSIEINPNNLPACIGRGDANRLLGKYELAISDFSKAIEIDPASYKKVYFYRAVSYAGIGKNDLALADLKKAAEENPEQADVYLWLGNVYVNLQQYPEAVTSYKLSIAKSKDAYSYCVLGVTYTKMSNFSSAVTSFEEGLKLNSNEEMAWCKAALENAKQGVPTP